MTLTAKILAASVAIAVTLSPNVSGASDLLDGLHDPAPAHERSDSWTGLYLGAFGGWASGDWSGPYSYDDAAQYPKITFDGSKKKIGGKDWFGGIAAGADKQFGSVVLGGVIDVASGNIGGSDRFVPYPVGLDPQNSGDPVWDATTEIEHFGTARLRAGYLVHSSLLAYATGGLAWAKVESSIASIHDAGGKNETASFASAEENHIGWTVGAGLEWKLASNVSLVGEYLYADLGKSDYRYAGDHATDNFHPDLELQIFKAGLNWRF